MRPDPRIALKALFQLGPEPVALNALYRLGVKTGHYRRTEAAALASPTTPGAFRSLFRLPSREELSKIIPRDAVPSLYRDADELVEGQIRLFGGPPLPLKLAFDQPLQHWSEYEDDPRLLSPFFSGISDFKFIWEPARFSWAFTLGRAYCLSGDPRYSGAFWKHFDVFASGNPPYLGPHWMNGQEVAIRLMGLVWAAQVFEPPHSAPESYTRLLRTIAEHAQRIPGTLVYARSQSNNHLVLEAAALFTAGVALDRSKWRDLGWRWLNTALQSQISSYGEYIQHSTNYHRVMLHAALWMDAILRGSGRGWPAATLQALMRASHWLFSMIDPVSGEAPNLGANDGALILPLSSASFLDHRPTVQAAARAFLRTSLPAGPWDELSLWLGLPVSQRTADSDAYMAEHPRGRYSWGYLRASRFSSRLSHMDQLHFDLWWRGLNVAQDAGTYLYSGEPPWDNPLVSTRVHNTVTVDGRDQMLRGGRFLTLDWFPAYSKNVVEVDERILGRMLAYHKGYRRIGVRHERIATVFTDEHWEIRDNLMLTGAGEHDFRLHWLLLDGEWALDKNAQGLRLTIITPKGKVQVSVYTEPSDLLLSASTSLVRAGELLSGSVGCLPFDGWISRMYGQKSPALSLALVVRSSRSFSFRTEFVLP